MLHTLDQSSGPDPRQILVLFLIFLGIVTPLAQDIRQEEGVDYYKRWLEEDALLIITPEENSVFESLSTPGEKENFIEQFWRRRDSTPLTQYNEFKQEHYRRIAYANERFRYGGTSGWKTDRGRIYIKFGPPDDLESHPHGGTYNHPMQEGGGSTWTFPFEIWRYRRIENVGQDIEIEFVDPSFGGEYRISLRPDEKDALLHAPKAGATFFELLGLADKAERPYFTPGNTYDRNYAGKIFQASKDMPFARMEQYFNLQRPPRTQFPELKTIVLAKVAYEQLPLLLRQDFIRLNQRNFLVLATIEVEHRNLTFKEKQDLMHASVDVYGLVTGLGGNVIAEFEDSLNKEYLSDEFAAALKGHSVYQKVLMLETGIYKIGLVARDYHGSSISTLEERIVLPKSEIDQLSTSSLILSRQLRKLEYLPDMAEQFVLGDIKIIPSVRRRFLQQERLGVYLQVYGAAVDQTTLAPVLKSRYSIFDELGTSVKEVLDPSGESVQFFSAQRVVLLRAINLQSLNLGTYKIQVQVTDEVSGETTQVEGGFSVVEDIG